MKKVIPIVIAIIIVILLFIYLSSKETPAIDGQIKKKTSEVTLSTSGDSPSLIDQTSGTPSPLPLQSNTVTLATDSADPNITYSTKSDPSIQPIDSENDPANQQVSTSNGL